MANNEEIPIPPEADKLLFAEDLINSVYNSAYVSEEFRSYFLDRAEPFRHLIYNGFNESVRNAIEIIDEYQDYVNVAYFMDLQDRDRLNLDTLTEYADNYHARHLAEGFEPAHFLVYCSRIAYLSGYFYQQGITEAAERAADLIVGSFPVGDMSPEMWVCLSDAAEAYVIVQEDAHNNPTPSPSSSEHSPDEEDLNGNE